ncbi:MAG: hemolysin III family protein [Acidobacteriota bacterium]|nr:hemolysin III family protein [Acidobacteriota bacterium]
MPNLSAQWRNPVSGLSHFFAAVAALGGWAALLLIFGFAPPGRAVALSIYGLSLVLLFGASAAYHLAKPGPKGLLILRKLDHSAIYLLIAGSYSPICALRLEGFWRGGMLAVIWTLALIGIGVKIFIIRAPRWLTAGIYIVMGWLAVIAVRPLLAALPTGALIWLAAGGIIYTLGAVIYIIRKPDFVPGVFGFHEVWHIFVILGALAHFIMIAVYIAPA